MGKMRAKKEDIMPMPNERFNVKIWLAVTIIIFTALAVLLILKLTGMIK
jgi:hypothetical protein